MEIKELVIRRVTHPVETIDPFKHWRIQTIRFEVE
jgi:hypothetical protein